MTSITRLLSTKEVSEILGTNVNYVIYLIITERLRYLQIGSKYKVPEEALSAFIKENENKKLPSYAEIEKEANEIKMKGLI